MSVLPPVFIELKANASEFTTAMGEARNEVAKLEKEGSGSFDKLAAFGKASLFAIGTAAVSVGAIGIHMADEFELSNAKLQTALKNTGTSFDALQVPIGAAQKKMEAYGYTNAQTQEALANLTTALGDPKKALNDLSLAADLAAYKHVSLAEAAVAVAKAQEGNLRALKQMGIDLPIAAGGAVKLASAHAALAKATENASAFLTLHSDAVNSASQYHAAYEVLLGKENAAQQKVNDTASAGAQVMEALSQKIGGQASTAAETFSGKMAALKAQSEDVAKNIGVALIPILEKLMTAIADVVKWFEKHKGIAEALGIVVGTVLVAAIGAYIISMGIALASSIATGAAMVATAVSAAAAWVVASGGIALVVAGIVAVVVYLATHWKEVWNFIKTSIHEAWDFIKHHTELIAIAFGPLGLAIKFFADHWESVWNGIKAVAQTVGRIISDIIGGISASIHAVTSALSAITNNPISKGIGNVIGGIESLIPHFAEGGIVTSPHIGLVGEAGPEAIIPLSKLGSVGGGGGSTNVTIHVAGSVVTQTDLVRSVQDGLAQIMRRRGLNPATIGV